VRKKGAVEFWIILNTELEVCP